MARKTVRLADLCSLIAEPVKPGSRHDAVYLGLEHLAPGRLTPIGSGKASEMRSNTSAFQPGDVLYGKLRPYLDKAVLADCPGVCTTELLVLRAKEGVDQRFLATVVHSPDFVEYAVAGTTGVQHPRTSWAHIREFEVPSFELEEQQRVAEVLWSIHDAITLSAKLAKEGHALKQTAMWILFTRGIRGETQKETEIGMIPESWCLSTLATLCITTDSVDIRSEGDRTIEYVDVSSISRDNLQIEKTSRHQLREAPGRARKRIAAKDVIFATVRPALLRAAIVPEKLNNQVCSTAFCVLRANRKISESKFIYYLVQHDQFIQQLIKAQTGASYPAVTDRIVKDQIVAVPSMDEQREIVAVLDAIDHKIDLHRRKRTVLEELFNALLQNLMSEKIQVEELSSPPTGTKLHRGKMSNQHPITKLEDSMPIWRYMDLGEFLTICYRSEINLAPVLATQDAWEGILPFELDPRPPFFQKDDVKKAGEDLYVSCWHMNHSPNAAMWGLYSNRRGIAIQSTVGRLSRSVQAAGPDFRIFPIKYTGFNFDTIPDMLPMHEASRHEHSRFTFKRQEYAFENELRVMRTGTDQPVAGELSGGDIYKSSLPVDLNVLFDSIHIHPDTEPWVFDAISGTLKKRTPRSLKWVHRSNMALIDYGIFTGIVAGENLEKIGAAVYIHPDGKAYRTPAKAGDSPVGLL